MRLRVSVRRGHLYHKYAHWDFVPFVHPFLELSHYRELALYLSHGGDFDYSTTDVAGLGAFRRELSTSVPGRLLFEYVDKEAEALTRLVDKTRKI